ncbi:MAG: cation acetate symporter [Alphaproteobacteria bacterium]|jgi:cation/acetate symporter|nr:cation acetate symporter [Alphaproteobacteria bacterium]MBU0802541.1 cation acetate symporter [Alphaproteobacteria bacterium]MBU0871338.1 cation acetate symporter [Alphaproteobacteria bacterium]MBU1400005.1 cation acetate symporter [Alphaproteobacteria bacterium]MBU1591125.1 cation acetate symporter [Alphaproteobacteria bacterium]
MATETAGKARFIDNLGKVYALYTLGFLAFFAFMAVLEKMGMGAQAIGVGFLLFTIAIYAIIGWLSRTAEVDAYYVAGREVPALYNGMATAADWMSGASFVALAGGVYFGGYPYLGFIVGWTGGYVLVNSLLAPYLRKFGCYTVPDFIGTRYGGNIARLCAVIVLVVASFTYVTAQINATGTIAAQTLGIPFELGVWLGLLGIFICSMLGGMRGVTWTQVAQYIVLIIAYLVPIIWMSNKQGFGIIPHFSYGDAVQRIAELEAQYGLKPALEAIPGVSVLTTPANAPAGQGWAMVSLAICMMAGTASLPHILMRYFTTPSVRSARRSVGWSLTFIFLLYFSAPALATLTKLQLLDPTLATSVIGKAFEDVSNLEWVKHWSSVGMLAVADQNGDGIVQLNEFFMRPDIVVLATPEIAGLPYVISGLVAAGGLAAAMSTADGLLLAIANALSHDLYYKIIDPKADTRRRLTVARVLLLFIGAAGALVASLKLTGILGAVAWAFDFACSGLFFPLVLGVWWKRANSAGAVAGMIGGFVVGSWYLYMVYNGLMDPWFGIDHIRFGIIGMPVSLVCMVVVSLLTPAPSKEVQDMVDEVRIPTGATILGTGH